MMSFAGNKLRAVVLGVALLLGLATIGVVATGFGPGFGGGPPPVHRLSGSFEHTGTAAPVDTPTPAPVETGSVSGSSTVAPDPAPQVTTDAPPAAPIINSACPSRGDHKKHDRPNSCQPADQKHWWSGWGGGNGNGDEGGD
jgi:hypothetical protein